MANQEMERALTFAGYEVNHVWGTGGQSTEHATSIFPDAVRWLWKDWPAPVTAGRVRRSCRRFSFPAKTGPWSQTVTASPRARPPDLTDGLSSTTSPTARHTRLALMAR